MDNLDIVCKYIKAGEPVKVRLPAHYNGKYLKGIPVNGEEHFNNVGMSHGIVHFKDPISGESNGFCGTSYFVKNVEKETIDE